MALEIWEIKALQKALDRVTSSMTFDEFNDLSESFSTSDLEYVGNLDRTDLVYGDSGSYPIFRVKGDSRLWIYGDDDERVESGVFLLPIWKYMFVWKPTAEGYTGMFRGNDINVDICLNTGDAKTAFCRADMKISDPDNEENPVIGESLFFKPAEGSLYAGDSNMQKVLINIAMGFFAPALENGAEIRYEGQDVLIDRLTITPLDRVNDGDEINIDRVKAWIEKYILETSYDGERKLAEAHLKIPAKDELIEMLTAYVDKDLETLLGKIYKKYGVKSGDIYPDQQMKLEELENKIASLLSDLVIQNAGESKRSKSNR